MLDLLRLLRKQKGAILGSAAADLLEQHQREMCATSTSNSFPLLQGCFTLLDLGIQAPLASSQQHPAVQLPPRCKLSPAPC